LTFERRAQLAITSTGIENMITLALAFLLSTSVSHQDLRNTLPGDHVGPGFMICRSYIDINRRQIAHWSDVFPTTRSSQDVSERWKAHTPIYGGKERVPACQKFRSAAEAEAWRANTRDSWPPVLTRWRD